MAIFILYFFIFLIIGHYCLNDFFYFSIKLVFLQTNKKYDFTNTFPIIKSKIIYINMAIIVNNILKINFCLNSLGNLMFFSIYIFVFL